MNLFRYALSVAAKEIQLLLRDRGALALNFLLPLFLGAMMGGMNAMSAAAEESAILFDVALVNEDAGPFGSQVTAAINSIDVLAVQQYDTAAEAEERVAKGEAAAAIVIPAHFTQEIDAHTPTTIDVIVDPGDPERASIIAGIMNQVVSEVTIWGEVQYGIRALLSDSGVLDGATAEQQRGIEAQTLGAIMTTLDEVRRAPLLTVASEDLTGAQTEGGWEAFFALLFPGFAVMFAFFSVAWSSAGLLVERETGTLRRLLAAPIPRVAIVVGKSLAFGLLCCIQTVLLLGVGSLFFDMPLGRSPVTLVILALIVALVATAMGMLVASLAKSSEQASNIGVLLGFVLGVLGGCIPIFTRVPLVRSQGFLGVISNLTPQGHAVDAYYRLMAENGSFLDVLPRMGILLAIGVIFYGVAAWRLRFE